MKRKNLQLSLVLTSIVLGGLFLGFSTKGIDSNFENESTAIKSLVNGNDPSVEYFSVIRNNQHTGVIALEDLHRLNEQMKQFQGSRSVSDIKWSQLGPDNYGGRTRAILFDNTDSQSKTLYAAGVSGGIWKSENVGISWRKVNEQTYNLNVTSMVQDNNGKIYVGTGEGFQSWGVSGLNQYGILSGFVGQGIYTSTDGENFSLLTSTQPALNNPDSDWAFVNELAVDNMSGNVYAATNTGLKYSSDGGDSWNIATDTAGTELAANSWEVSVSENGIVVACVDNLCYLSTSGNPDEFVLKSTGDSVSLPVDNVGRIEFAFAPSDPNVLYASVVNAVGQLEGIYLSEDVGENWRTILPASNSLGIFLGWGVYNNALAVNPGNPYKVLLGGFYGWEGEMVQETGYFAWKSISTNATLPYLPNYLPSGHNAYVFQPGDNSTFFIGTNGGVAIGSIVEGEYEFETSNRSYFTTQFYSVGVSGSMNFVTGGGQEVGNILITGEGNTVNQGEVLLTGYGGSTVISKIDRNVLVVSTIDGVNFRSNDAGENWSNQFMDDLSIATTNFYTPTALWESFDNLNSRDSVMYYASENEASGTTVQVRSNNSGQPFYYTLEEDLPAGDSVLVQDIVSSRFFIASFNKVYMTAELHQFDKTPEWFEISNFDEGFVGTAQSIGVSNDANYIFVGTQDGKLYRIANLALAYNYARADVSSPECIVSTQEIPLTVPGTSDPITQSVTSVSVDPENPQNVMITLGNYGNEQFVMYSENALDEVPEFRTRQGNLPQMPVYSSVIEMSNPDMAFIGTDKGIFVTENIHSDNPVWTQHDSLMGNVPVMQLKQQTVAKTADTVYLKNGLETIVVPYPGTDNYGIIYAASYGRGLFRCNTYRQSVGINEKPAQTESKILNVMIYPNPVANDASVKIEAVEGSNAQLNVFDLNGRIVKSYQIELSKGSNEIYMEASDLTVGTYIIQVIAGSDMYSGKFIKN